MQQKINIKPEGINFLLVIHRIAKINPSISIKRKAKTQPQSCGVQVRGS